MRSRFRTLTAALALSLMGACASAPMSHTNVDKPQPHVVVKSQDAIRAEWRATLAARRKLAIQRLHDYQVAGVFPMNTSGNVMQRVFRDDAGHLCAMANLIWLSGKTSLVDATVKTDNGIALGDVKSGPLMDWMLTSGLTQEEIAFVQEPDFRYEEQPSAIDRERTRLQMHFQQAEQLLNDDTDKSLDLAVDRLMPRVAKGDLPSDA